VWIEANWVWPSGEIKTKHYLYYLHYLYCFSDPPGPIDNSNILFMKGNTKILRASEYFDTFFVILELHVYEIIKNILHFAHFYERQIQEIHEVKIPER